MRKGRCLAVVALWAMGMVLAGGREWSNVRVIERELDGELVLETVSMREAWELRRLGVQFMDVTDTGRFAADVADKYYGIPTNCTHQSIVEPLFVEIDEHRMFEFDLRFSAHYNRFFNTPSGTRAAEWLAAEYTRVVERSGRSDATVRFFNHTFTQPSVIVTVEGSGPNSDEVVILGAHLDSVNWNAEVPELGRSPGAGDDGSGSTAMFAAFEILLNSGFRPSRRIEFHAYSGEEVGLLGSGEIAATYLAEGVKVASMVEFDEVAFQTTWAPPGVALIQDNTSPQLNEFLVSAIRTYTNVGNYSDYCGYGCSDFFSFTKAGYQASFPTQGASGPSVDGGAEAQWAPIRHTVDDSIDKLSFTFMAEFVRLALGYLVEVSLYVSY
mmetsp:Transcript_26517/g.74114  ORF Transcript_26517/g.74114 Transcript_26517/m.74114 type:complete len:383 (+) Transcript_26517:160-1308(+)